MDVLEEGVETQSSRFEPIYLNCYAPVNSVVDYVHAKDVGHTAPCAVVGAGYAQNAAGDGGLSLYH